MGGRQRGKKNIDPETDAVESQSAKTDENITASAMQWHKTEGEEGEDLKALRQLIDIRVDDPRVVEMDPRDPSLVIDKFNVRKQVDSGFVERLHDSMLADGQQKAIVVTPRGNDKLVVIGNTRVRAARADFQAFRWARKKLTKIYVLSMPLTDKQAWLLSLQSNLDNELPTHALNNEEQGNAVLKMIEDYQMTQQQVAELVHRDQSWVSRQIRLAKVDPEVESMVKSGTITESHAEVIMTLPRTFQGQIAREAEYDELTVQQTQKLVNDVKAVLKEAEGIPEDLVEEGIIQEMVLDSKRRKSDFVLLQLPKIIETTKAIRAGLKALSPEIKESGYSHQDDFAATITEKKMSPEAAELFAKSLNELAQETATLRKENGKNILEAVLNGNKSIDDARVNIGITKLALEGKVLPKHVREIVANEFAGPIHTFGRETKIKYNAESAKQLVTSLGTIFDDVVKNFPQGVQTQLAQRIIEKGYKAETGQKLAAAVQAVLEDSKDLATEKQLRSDLVKHVIDHNYSVESGKQLAAAVKRALDAGKDAYDIQAELKWRSPKEWKILSLTPEMEATHKEEEERQRAEEEAASVADVDDMIRNGQTTESEIAPIRTLPKIVQGIVANSLTYEDEDGNEHVLGAEGIKKMVAAVQQRIEGKTPEEIYVLARRIPSDLNAVLEADKYVEKPKEEPKTQAAITHGIREQLFGREASATPIGQSESPAATYENTVEEVVTGKRSDVEDVTNEAGLRLLKFSCPHCGVHLVVDPEELSATVEEK